jgi:hypothetical protein
VSFFATAHELLAYREAGAPWAALARLAGWQDSAVRSIVSKARTGKLREPGQPRAGAWSPQEDATLDMHWEHENSHRIAARLGRSHWAVNSRARRRGLVKPGTRASWSWCARRAP